MTDPAALLAVTLVAAALLTDDALPTLSPLPRTRRFCP
jgi:hypothetical protein